MTEPQDVLADLLRRLDGWAGDAATRYERADEMVDVARRELRAVLVRTPETLDVDGLLAELSESPLPGARYAYEVVKRRLQSPTPPEGLRAAVALIAADWFDTGYENGRLDHGVLADRLFAALAASPAPDPGAGAGPLFIDSLARAMAKYRDGDAGRWLDHVMEAAQLVAVYAAPSAEPPETETP